VIVTSADIRYHLRRLLATEYPAITVLSYREIEPSVKLESLGRIAVGA
jgi:type III secretory pathway component EscV